MSNHTGLDAEILEVELLRAQKQEEQSNPSGLSYVDMQKKSS